MIAPHASVGAVYARVAARNGCGALSVEELDRRFRQAWKRVDGFQHRREDWEALVDQVFQGLVPEPPSRTFFGELYDEFARPDAWQVFDDVIPTLEWLAGAGMDLAVISNWDERLRPLLRGLRLDRYFNVIVVSGELGFPKPSPVIFDEALRQLGCPASAALHVGDELRDDFSGATAAGMQALHLRRDAESRDLQIQSLAGIPQWLSS